MKHSIKWFSFLFIIASLFYQSVLADTANPNFLSGDWGTINVDVRYRLDDVEQDGPDKFATAQTLRNRVGYLTPVWESWQAFAEYEGTNRLFASEYNSGRNGDAAHLTVPDPSQDEVNQLWLKYTGLPDTIATLGRQRLTVGDMRFIGNSPWRQLEQTFDALTVKNTSLKDVNIFGAWLFGRQTVLSQHEWIQGGLVNVAYAGFKPSLFLGYAYVFNLDTAKQYSSQTYGLRYEGKYAVAEKLDVLTHAEYAHQWDFGNNPLKYDASYYRGETGLAYNANLPFLTSLVGKIGYENLGEGKEGAFQTPLATIHPFQGWADKFAVTPADGVGDAYVNLQAKIDTWTLTGAYHKFGKANQVGGYGDEFDVMVTYAPVKHLELLVKMADYSSDGFAADTRKFWVQATVSF